MPILKRKMAIAAASESPSAHGSTLLKTGTSNDEGNTGTGTVALNTLWIANQAAKLRTTPTTAAVIADSAPLSARLPRNTSTNGAPRKIQRKHGMNVTHVASNPPSVAATSGD